MSLIGSNPQVSSMPLFCPLWKIVNDWKDYVHAVPMIIPFKLLKFFFCGIINCFLFDSMCQEYL